MNSISAINLINDISTNCEENNQHRIKTFKQRKNPFDLQDEEFRYKYRFSKRTVNKIVDMLKPELTLNQRGKGTSTHLQVLTALRCWGRREVQDDAGDLHGLSQPTVSRICARVARALAKQAKAFITMPQTLEEKIIMKEFYKIRNFPSVIGAVDCTHIRIKKVAGDSSQYYINRKGYYSLNVQMVCDANLKIQNVVARWRGSTHDSRIFCESLLKQEFEQNRYRGRLLGDSGYKQTRYLFTPLLRTTSIKEERYNSAHIATRNTIERCFGVLKQRFRCLLDGLRISLPNAKILIVALAVLHNIAIQEKESIPEQDEQIYEASDTEPNVEDFQQDVPLRAKDQAVLRSFIEKYF